jgi:hypothetical protein
MEIINKEQKYINVTITCVNEKSEEVGRPKCIPDNTD